MADIALFELIDKRLELMQAVAAHKWTYQLAIEDTGREATVIENARRSAIKTGIPADQVAAFFAAQIGAAKEIQHYWFLRWQAGEQPGDAPDLKSQIRPHLIELGNEINLALVSTQDMPLLRVAFDNRVQVEGLGKQSKDALFRALVDIKPYPNRLQQIIDTGVLRIGTTGDYAPFSLWPDAQALPTGTDIEMALSLAKALGVEPVFFRTSWPTLTQDLMAGEYDIAMSGVSLTQARKKYGAFSAPYHVGGKTLLARCEDKVRFGSLAAIDKNSTTLIVNPGGTNQKFVDAHIKHARIVVFADNRGIFEELVSRRADVMITDRAEVQLQTSLHPQLCATMQDNLSYQEKAYLMPKDSTLTDAVNGWLAKIASDYTTP